MSDVSNFERLDELEELEAHLSAALHGVREERARIEASMTPAAKRARSEVERINHDRVMAERARIEAETECDRELEIRIGPRRVLRATLRDPRRQRELEDLARAGIVSPSGHFLPQWTIGFGDEPGEGELA